MGTTRMHPAKRYAKRIEIEQLAELAQPATHEDLLRELERTSSALKVLQAKIARLP